MTTSAQASVVPHKVDRVPEAHTLNGAAEPATAIGRWVSRRSPSGGEADDAEQIAAEMTATWQAIQTALTPIIGQRGVAALYKRSLHIACGAAPWLIEVQGADKHLPLEFGPLQAAFAGQTNGSAAAGGEALLLTFHGLLVSLVGASLTERLLQPVLIRTAADPQAPPS